MKHEELPLRDPIFVASLPFDEVRIPRYVTERVLHRTRRNWQWFIDARSSNPVLGTLGHLPFEVRRMIWEDLLHCRATLSSDGLWEYEAKLGPVFDLSAYYFGFGRRSLEGRKAQNLRLVSSALRREYEDVFLTGRTFKFNYGGNLSAFIDGLGCLDLETSVRRIGIGYGVCSVQQMDDFVQPMANLWHELREVDILVFPTSSDILERRGNENVLDGLREVIEGAAKSAPEARITIRSTNEQPLPRMCEVVVDTTLERISLQGTHHREETSIVPVER